MKVFNTLGQLQVELTTSTGTLADFGVRADFDVLITTAGTVVTFSAPVASTDYVVEIVKCVKDDDPTVGEACTISAKTVNGFTATSFPDNAKLDYVVIPKT